MNTGNGVPSPRIFIGSPAFPAAGSGWTDGASFQAILEQVPALGLPNLGGVSFWDGAYGALSGMEGEGPGFGTTGIKGKSYMDLAKEVLA